MPNKINPYRMLSENTILAIKESANIVEVIGDFVELKKKGPLYVGKSPFNNERTPSFTVAPVKGIFKDFSSGKGGDVIEFLMQHLSFSYHDSLRYIAKKYSIDADRDVAYTIPIKLPVPELPTSYIKPADVESTWCKYEANPLVKFLGVKFGMVQVVQAFHTYGIGIDARFNEWVIFWQIDTKGNVRSGKYIKYGDNGKRCKSHNPFWHHSRVVKQQPLYPDFNLAQCFFGEHLLNGDIKKPIAIVESEKTALVASLCMPNYFWLACGSKYGINDKKVEVLKGRSVTLFPDLDAYGEWRELAVRYSYSVSHTIQNKSTDEDKLNKLDIADYLLR